MNGSCPVRSISGTLRDPPPTPPLPVPFVDVGGWMRQHSVMASKKIIYKPRRNIFKAIWPHILLIVLLAVYIFGGAWAFLYLERPTEIRLKSDGIRMVERQKERLREFVLSSLGTDLLLRPTNASSNSSSSSPNSTFNSTSTSNLDLSQLELVSMNDTKTPDDLDRWREQFDRALMDYTRVVLRAMRDNFIEHSILFDDERKDEDLWTLPASVLFAFSCVTTIGYGNIAPITFRGRLFCIFYGLIGIPFAMLVLANVGKFLSEGLRHVVGFSTRVRHRFVRRLRANLACMRRFGSSGKMDEMNHHNNNDRYSNSTSSDEEDADKQIDQPLPFVCLIGLVFGYICLGAVLLPSWESFSFFDAFYFNFVTITTVGFGDLVPQRFKFLAVTLIYVAVGIAMTTMCIEAAAAYMRKMHYVGRRIQGAKFTKIRFGDKMITVEELVTSLGVKFGVPTKEVVRLKTKLDAFVATAIETRHLEPEQKVAALTSFDDESPADALPNGGGGPARRHSEEDEDLDTWTNVSLFLPELTAPLRRLLGAFNVSDSDIRYIDDERLETVV